MKLELVYLKGQKNVCEKPKIITNIEKYLENEKFNVTRNVRAVYEMLRKCK